MSRPNLTKTLVSDDFMAYYWLKTELVSFCRTEGMPSSGSKGDLTERIRHYLETGQIKKSVRKTTKTDMPDKFSRETVIGKNWRCSQSLRAFFEQEIGSKFHFNGVMRDFIKQDGVGLPLQAAIDCWHEAQQQPASEKEIGAQFEYNRHFREYFKQNPGATRQEAIAAWNEKKAKRK